MDEINKRLEQIEKRLSSLEQKLGLTNQATPAIKATAVQPQANTTPKPVTNTNALPPTDDMTSATRLMGWCAGFTFLLAMTYFLKLVYDSGWLTPLRQIGLAYLSGFLLMATGLFLEKRERHYAAYLPAIGLVILYLTTFTGHLYYQLLETSQATITIGVTTLLGIWLGRKFEHSIYTVFSAVGVYITPLLIHSEHGNLIDLIVYYSAWSLLFSFCAIQEQRRLTYLLPLYLAMLGFDVAWRLAGNLEWELAALYQLVQFIIFSITTVLFSITHQKPMNSDNAVAHGLALAIFYGLEYTLLKQHVPDVVNEVAILSAVFVYTLFFIARKLYAGNHSLEQGGALVSWYCSWVAVHAGFFGLLPERWFAWAVLLTPFIFLLLANSAKESKKIRLPIALACGGLYLVGYGSLVLDVLTKQPVSTPMPTLALFLYVLMLYGIYYQLSQKAAPSNNAGLALYGGHLALMACTIDVIQHDMYLSALWACYAVVLLIIAMRLKDKILGQSALLIFCASGLKVLLFDLSDSNSLIRVMVLLVLSVSLYVGGWLYQSLSRRVQTP